MEYNLKINETLVPVEVAPKEDRQFCVVMEEETYQVTCDVISGNQLHLVINGERLNAFLLTESDSCKEILINGSPYRVEDADLADRQATRRKRPGEIPKEVTPPMPSVVVRLLVTEGEDVSKGDGVVVVSAMKMETTLSAPFDGKVARINVSEGEKVMPGQILVDINPAAA